MVKSKSCSLCYYHPSKSINLKFSKETLISQNTSMWHKPQRSYMNLNRKLHRRGNCHPFTSSFLSTWPVRLKISFAKWKNTNTPKPGHIRLEVGSQRHNFIYIRHISYPKLLLHLNSLIKLIFIKNFMGK